MSYSLSMSADLGGPEPLDLCLDWNYTRNCSPMWRAAGVDLQEFDGKTAAECAGLLAPAIAELRSDPDKYRAMNPANGWGDYDSLLTAFDRLLALLEQAPRALVRVSY